MGLDMHVAPSWDYVPVGPYTVQAVSLVGDKRCPPFLECRATLGEALHLFESVRSPLPERSAIVTDFNDITVVAFATSPRWHLQWIGTAAAFETMREHEVLDPMQIELAEIEAHAGWSTE